MTIIKQIENWFKAVVPNPTDEAWDYKEIMNNRDAV